MKRLLGFALLFFLSAIPAFGQSTNGNVTAANTTCTPGVCVSMTLSTSAGAASITLTGTFSGTLNFELSGDNGVTWTAAPTASSTSAGVTNFNVAGYSNIRVRGNPFVSGTANVTIFAGAGSKIGTSSGGSAVSTAGTLASGNIVTGAGGTSVQDSGVALTALQTTANVSAGCISGCYYALGLGDGANISAAAGSALATANQPAFFRFYNSQARAITTGCFEITTVSAGGLADVAVYSVSGTALTRVWHTGTKSTTSLAAVCGTATVANLAAGQNYYIAFCADNNVAAVGQLVGNSGGITLILGGANAPNTYGLNATDVSTLGVCPASATTTNITNNNAKLLATGLQVFN